MEENKVATRDKLAAMRLPEDAHASAYPKLGYKWADAILQSPDLRVTLVEPRYSAFGTHVYEFANSRTTVLGNFCDAKRASEYAQFLNSKEPK
jgi:hypothetical protein